MKRLILYYSLSGNTEEAASQLAKILDAKIARIDLKKKMPSSMAAQMFTGGMQATFGMCPKISGIPDDLETYDEIIIGMPIWASKPASPICTLAKNKVIKEKTVAAFTLSGGGDNDKCAAVLHSWFPGIKMIEALADRQNKLSEKNACKIEKIARGILNA